MNERGMQQATPPVVPKILALTRDSVDEGCTSVRIMTPLRTLIAQHKVVADHQLVTPWRPWSTRSLGRLLRELSNWDIVWIARPLDWTILLVIREARRLRKPILIDLDDWLLDVPANNPDADFFRTRPRREIVHTALRAATAVTVSTHCLADWCTVLGLRTHVLPNAIDADQFKLPPRHDDRLVVAFCGTATHSDDLSLVARPLYDVLRQHKGRVRVVAVGCPIPELQGMDGYEHHASVPAGKYPSLLSRLCIDIGLAPLHDTTFNRAKSDIKYLEYSAVGAVTIASAVTPYLSSIREERGMLVQPNNMEGWSRAINLAVGDSPLRHRLGAAARDWVRRERSIQATAGRWEAVFREYAYGRLRTIPPRGRNMDQDYFGRVLANIVLRELPYDLRQSVRVLVPLAEVHKRLAVTKSMPN
jgi:O-antigen biosynthesis protein